MTWQYISWSLDTPIFTEDDIVDIYSFEYAIFIFFILLTTCYLALTKRSHASIKFF